MCGCIDGTHVLVNPPNHIEQSFVNRHHQYSLNVLGVAGPDLKFYYINANYPGRCHDAGVLRKTSLCTSFEAGFRPFPKAVILGDSAYPLREWLITPYRGTPEGAKNLFNRSHIKTRNTVERAFGVLKHRFYALKTGIRVKDMEFASRLVIAAMVLHNMCIDVGDDFSEAEDDPRFSERGSNEAEDPEPVESRREQILASFVQPN